MRIRVGRRPRQACYLYVPHRVEQPARLLVAVHGISRNAREHAELFATLAAERGVIVVAPRFGRKCFAGYQRLAPDRGGRPADAVFDEIIVEVRALLDLPEAPLHLFGFSGGGQFVHRYAMAHPEKVARAVIGAAGWYTFPDPGARYPRGLRVPSGRPALASPAFLRVPMAAVVGDRDTARDDALNQSPRVDRQQGRDRFERGRRWVDAMRAAARCRGLDTRYEFVALPGVGHDFADAMMRGGMGQAVFAFLFDDRSPAVAAAASRPCWPHHERR
jgi:pimeloyl-ACP methyl ester carboxylesterase